jgi:long-subunit fatty acid transport protein
MVAGDVGALNDTTASSRSNWSVFTRERSGGVYSLTAALACKLTDRIQIGAKLNYLIGQTDDLQDLNRIGYFRFKNGNSASSWSFSYDMNDSLIQGTSKYYGTSFNIGVLYVSKNVNLGFNVQLPYKIERDWSYSTQVSTLDSNKNLSIASSAISGNDYVTMPAVYTAGITVRTETGFTLSFDYEYNPLGSATYQLSSTPDSLFTKYQKWVDQTAYRFGIEYAINDNFSIMGGYQVQGAPFVGYAVADQSQGAPVDKYSCGLSLNILHGRFDVSCTYSQLKYYDVYTSNTNFTLIRSQAILLGYTFIL